MSKQAREAERIFAQKLGIRAFVEDRKDGYHCIRLGCSNPHTLQWFGMISGWWESLELWTRNHVTPERWEIVESRTWAIQAAEHFLSAVLKEFNQWQKVAAEALENLSGESIRCLISRSMTYNRNCVPPSSAWVRETSDPQRVHVANAAPAPEAWRTTEKHVWNCFIREAVDELWVRFQDREDPPGYQWEPKGEQRQTTLWCWSWAGVNRTESDCAKDRSAARQDAWDDFWYWNRAHALEIVPPVSRGSHAPQSEPAI